MTAKPKVRRHLVERSELWVVHHDGTEHHYVSTPFDYWRAEKITGRPIHECVGSFDGIAAIAYSCALRLEHTYKARRAGTDLAELMAEWLLTVADVDVLADDTGDGLGTPVDPTEPASPAPSQD